MATTTMRAHKKETEVREESVAIPRSEYVAVAQRLQMGKELREKVPRTASAEWEPPSDRRDPVEVLLETEKDRLPELLPIRHGRMMVSPLSYLRGAAAMMAYDLSGTPNTGMRVQACGDCHLGNFGAFATPERNLVFDVNDFDETIPAPWEWDIKRLAASIYVCGLDNKLSERHCLELVTICGSSYREFMRELSAMNPLDMWYYQLSVEVVASKAKDKEGIKNLEKANKDARRNVTSHLYPKLTDEVDGHRQIIDEPPLIYHLPERRAWPEIMDILKKYRESMEPARRILFDQYHLEDFAMKVVGVGSVGTRCGIGLFLADANAPLILQVKEAVHSVLEPYAGKSEYEHQGQRVVEGQRIIQTNSDIMLGWATIDGRHYYIRQLKDMKLSFNYVESNFDLLSRYAHICGWALAKAHARSGDPAMITGYLGKGDTFDKALASFAQQYAKQNTLDHQALTEAVHSGRIEAEEGK